MGAALPIITVAAGVASAGLGAYGAMQNSAAQRDAANYQAQVARNNQIIAGQNADYARQAGAAQETAQRLKTAALEGKQRAAMAANGFDVNSGTNLDLTGSAAVLGETDARTIRSSAERTARNYISQGADFGNQAQLTTMQGKAATTASTISGAASLLGGASSVAQKWYGYNKAGDDPLKGLFD